MKQKENLETDLKSLDILEPSEGFASRVTLNAMLQLQNKEQSQFYPLMEWIPRFCIVGFLVVFIILAMIIIHHYGLGIFTSNVIAVIRIIGLCGGGMLIYFLLDQQLARMILR